MRNLFFRIDSVQGIRKLRQEVWIAVAVILGIALLVCVELGDARRSRAKIELVMENEAFVMAGERILPVNKEIWDLVEGNQVLQEAEVTGTPPEQGRAPEVPWAPALPVLPAPPAPHFPAVEKKAVPVASDSCVDTAATTSGFFVEANETASNYAVPYANMNINSLALDAGALNLYRETVRDLGFVKGSGVAYKRLDDQAIQNRDSTQTEQVAGLPIGTAISAELITGVISGAPAEVLMLVKQDVVAREMVVIPAGTVLLGTAVSDYKAGRIIINVEWLICGNAEIKISGLVYDASGQAGLADRRINAAARKLIPAFFAGILAEFGRAFSGQQAVIPELALAKVSETNATMQVLVEGAGSGLDAVARVLAEQAAREGTVIIVNPGKMIRIVLLQKIPFDILIGISGSRVR